MADYERQLRKAMLAIEEIAGDTETPMRERIAAIKRVRDFCDVLVVQCSPSNGKHSVEDDD